MSTKQFGNTIYKVDDLQQAYNMTLQEYIEQEILPRYADFDK